MRHETGRGEDEHSGDHLMTTRQVADALFVSEPTVRRLIKRGQLRASRVGDRVWRVHPDDLRAYIAQHRNL